MFTIDGKPVGLGHAPYVVAELSGNHNQNLERALDLVRAAHACGADAIKLQTYTADTITIDHDAPEFTVQGGLWAGRRLHELYQEAHTPWDWHKPLFDEARALGITIFSSPFDKTAVDFLEDLNAPAYKIASPELVDVPLIQYAAATGKPLIMSTGMASDDEIHEAVAAARDGGCKNLVLLHCTAAYPAQPKDMNLATIPAMRTKFGVPIGLSDHSLGTTVPIAAVALGAVLIEKHFTLSRAEGGVDSAFSLEPDELRALTIAARDASAALGEIVIGAIDAEASVLRNRRSLYVVRPVKRGQLLDEGNIRSIRPSGGLAPKHLARVLGQRAARDLEFGEPLDDTMFTDQALTRGDQT